jgi:hypothetical protein
LPDGHLLHLSYGKASLFHILLDAENQPAQAAVMRFSLRFGTGLMRGRFHPKDGQLYLAGLRGWQTSGVRDGLLERVRYTGSPLRMPTAFRAMPDGIALTFSEALDPESASDPESFGVEQWNYRWTEAYGSADYSLVEPDTAGRDPVKVLEAALDADGRTLRLRLEDFKPVMQLRVQYRLKTNDGAVLSDEIVATINRVPRARD